ncbi:uncharacterized protein SCODWIG_02473 [Saccharomycodes ludwigii]|uniref:SRP9 domain-containing protein n=1 Tax=Saccharomycodes ludwigii TaxID=36035 RepID=A0A376B7T7_9ASCO|nr:hypothetical protein SCDLUD_004013 [Saccharomycodes ludwigii]KAH3899727.1 hypothetical protein SCDLUD_004013 [Saccharomycodes ludwigii]SSD60712.1 uncharacterized protein SCODWIG_02473 [Saccharomycodes ludwigii]
MQPPPTNYPVKPVDTYIKSTSNLLEANPSQTLLTIKYNIVNHHKKSKENKGETSDKNTVNIKFNTSVTFQTKNPELGLFHDYTTNKVKEVSRVLSALGPKGVTMNVNNNKVLKKKDFLYSNLKGKNKKKQKKSSTSLISNNRKTTKPIRYTTAHKELVNIIGGATLLTNTEIKEHVIESTKKQNNKGPKSAVVPDTTITTGPSSKSSNSNKKKKNRKSGKNKRR